MKREILQNKFIYFLLAIILIAATYVRVYRTDVILHFFYDQGRDALVIWDFVQNGNFFLIGPTTGIAGIFRGPFYYYLIAPFYWLGGGDPVYPDVFLALTTVAAIAFMFYILKLFKDRTTGIFAAILASLSFYLMYASRWLSNPTPMLFLSMLFVFSFYLIMNKKQWAWVLLSFTAGLSLFHFGSSGEFFYFPAILIFAIWQYKKFPNIKIIFLSALAFLLTASPLILFDFRNDFLLFNNIKAFIFEKESFKTSFSEVLTKRLDLYNGVFWGNIFPSPNNVTRYLVYGFSFLFLFLLPKLLVNKYFKLTSLILLSPIIGLLFFQGNEGNVYGYYLTGYYLIAVLWMALVLREIWQFWPGKIFVLVFLYIFTTSNWAIIKGFINDNVDGPSTIAYRPQKQAIEWIYKNASGENFNVDVYVPPVIPYAYDYLFTWYESKSEYNGKIDENIELLYTLYEQDPGHPDRLQAWMDRQKGIGEVVETATFSGITVERRKRVLY